MAHVNVFYQGEHFGAMQHLQVDADITIAALKAQLIALHPELEGTELFLEDEDEPLAPDMRLLKLKASKGIKLQLHRCRKIDVAVTYNARTFEKHFPPSAAIARIKKWAVREFDMGEADASEHALQIVGTTDRPNPGTHVGSLTSSGCRIAFDLVAIERVNGHSEASA